MAHLDRFAPRALPRRHTITVSVSPYELHLLIETLESRATFAADNPETIDFADFLFCRIAELREAAR